MMKEYPNFFENYQEFSRRLMNTIVTYDGAPYQIIEVGAHKADGIFRVYLYPCANGHITHLNYPTEAINTYPAGSTARAEAIDRWLVTDAGKTSGVLRKKANSPLFNKYRPFPLGMMNLKGRTYYLARNPQRHVEQGLTRRGVLVSRVNLVPENLGAGAINFETTPEFHDCVVGNYPSIKECLDNMVDPEVSNEAVAFHRDFALVRGPLNLIFLAYKTDVIGLVPRAMVPEVKLASKFAHYREVVANTGAFQQITIE